jgi:DNA-binding MarR family transcriptional regulator
MRSEDVNTRILVRLWDVAEVSRRRCEAALTMRADCTLKQFMILDLIESTTQNITPTALARRLACSRPNITQILREMRQRGWLIFTPEYSDGRSSIMGVSETGRAAYASTARVLVEAAYAQLESLEVDEMQRLATILRKLALARWSSRAVGEHG